jgi:YhcH/YjgK/YiaL family protein
MIVDRLDLLARGFPLLPELIEVEQFLKRQGPDGPPLGRHEIDGTRLYVLVAEGPGKPRDTVRLEAHRRYIDVQLTLAGEEVIGWRPTPCCQVPAGAYNPDKDIVFFGDAPYGWLAVPPGHFAIFFPEDAHAPMAGSGAIRKAVFKIACPSS